MTELAITTQKLCKSFGANRALIDVDLNIKAGITTGLVGPNGAGKTTLFSLLCGFLKPSKGSLQVLGASPDSPLIRGQVAILPQDAALLKALSIGKQLAMLAELQGFNKQAADEEANRVLKLVGLYRSKNQLPERLSHGMQKRVAIAQAFIGSPQIIMLDEPTAGLDPTTADAIKAVVRQLSSQCTIIISSHNLEVIEDLCQQIIILKQGRLHAHEAVAELTVRTQALTFKLEQEPPADVAQLFQDLAFVTTVKTGQAGQQRMVVYFSDEQEPMAEIEIIKCLAMAGIKYREMIRGERLQDSVVDRLEETGQA